MKQEPLSLSARIIILVYLIAAPLLLMVADSLHYFGYYVIAVITFKLALVAFILGAFGTAYLLPERSKYFGLVGSGLITLGAITLSAISTADLFNLLFERSGYTQQQIENMQQTLISANGIKAVYLPVGFAFPLGLFVLAIGIFRGGYTPKYISYIMCAGALIFTIARFTESLPFLLISEAALCIASSSTGFHMTRISVKRKK